MSISAVIVSRNDDYGGNLALRATICLRNMVETFDEVVYVDWASESRTLLEEIDTNFPGRNRIRQIQISAKIAKELLSHVRRTPYNSDDCAIQHCVEVLGRNIGIRRAQGDFVVSTNIDIVPPTRSELDAFVSTIDEKMFYTFARRDVPIDWFKNGVVDAVAFAQKLRENASSFFQMRSQPGGTIERPGDFQLAHRQIWNHIRGFEEEMIYAGRADENVQIKAQSLPREICSGLKAVFHCPLFHLNHLPDRGVCGTPANSTTQLNDREYYVNRVNTQNDSSWGFGDFEFDERPI